MAAYDITQLDEEVVDASGQNRHFKVLQLDATHVAVIYEGSAGDGFIKTYAVDGSYIISSALHTLEFDTADGTDCDACMIDATHFVVAYRGVGTDGFIATFSFNGSYEVTKIHSIEHDTADSYNFAIAQIDATHVMLLYRSNNSVIAKTFTINGSYNISQTDSETLSGSVQGTEGWGLVQINATHYLGVYSAGGSGYAVTLSVNGSFIITVVDTEAIPTLGAYGMSAQRLVKLTDTNYVTSFNDYTGTSPNIAMYTLSVDGSYLITAQTRHAIITSGSGSIYSADESASMLRIDDTHFIWSRGLDYDKGYTKSFQLNGDYTLTELDSLETAFYEQDRTTLAPLDESHFALGYFRVGSGTKLKTFSVELGGFTASPLIHQMAQAGGLL